MSTIEHRQMVVAGLAEQIGEERAEKLAAAADAYFSDEYPATVETYMNALLREAWLEDHGSTKRWDRSARANGLRTIGKVILPK